MKDPGQKLDWIFDLKRVRAITRRVLCIGLDLWIWIESEDLLTSLQLLFSRVMGFKFRRFG